MSMSFMVGKTDAVDGVYVGTRFFFFIGPLLPTESMYVVSESSRSVGRGTVFSYQGVKLPLQWKSVLLGYVRVWLFWLAIVYPFYRHWGELVVFTPDVTWIPPIAMLVAWVFFLIVPGRLSETEKKRRRLLARYTSFLLDPAQLDRFRRNVAIEELELKLKVGEGIPSEPAALDQQVDALPVDEAGLAYTYAAYRAVKDASFRPVRDRLWARLAKAA